MEDTGDRLGGIQCDVLCVEERQRCMGLVVNTFCGPVRVWLDWTRMAASEEIKRICKQIYKGLGQRWPPLLPPVLRLNSPQDCC